MSASNNNTGSNSSGSGENSTGNSQLRDVRDNTVPPSGDEYDGEVESNADTSGESGDDSETTEEFAPPTAASIALAAANRQLTSFAANRLYEAVLMMGTSYSDSDTDSETETETADETADETEDETEDEDEGAPQGLGLPSRVDYIAEGNVNGTLRQSHPAASAVARMNDETCRICLEDLAGTAPADILVIMACGHRFHKDCILGWFYSYSSCHGTCPVDRTRLFTHPGHEGCGEEHEENSD